MAGKSHFKIAADLVIEDCMANGHQVCTKSQYYWAYILFFEQIKSNFDLDKFNDYINKRI